jgi:hypothetical protein
VKRPVLTPIASLLATLCALAATPPARAAGPVSGELTALWWTSDSSITSTSEGSSAGGGRADLWFIDKVGLAGSLFAANPGGTMSGNDLRWAQADVKWRWMSLSKNNFIATGLGWERLSVDGLDDNISTGPRLVVEGRAGIVRILYFYGRGAWMPKLSDIGSTAASLTNGNGREAEAGFQIKPWPFVQFFVGYRYDYAGYDSPVGPIDIETKGPVVGTGFNF